MSGAGNEGGPNVVAAGLRREEESGHQTSRWPRSGGSSGGSGRAAGETVAGAGLDVTRPLR